VYSHYCHYQSLSSDISEHFIDVITVTGVDLSHRRRHFGSVKSWFSISKWSLQSFYCIKITIVQFNIWWFLMRLLCLMTVFVTKFYLLETVVYSPKAICYRSFDQMDRVNLAWRSVKGLMWMHFTFSMDNIHSDVFVTIYKVEISHHDIW